MPLPEVLWSAFTVVVSVSGSWFIAWWTIRVDRASSAQVAAVNKLLPSLARLRALLHESSVRSSGSADVAAAVNDFESLCMQHAAALPLGLRSIRRDARAAIGSYFGGVSLASVDARMSNFPLTEPHPYWREISISYVEYVMERLQQSLLQPKGASIIHFSDWRQREDDSQR